MKSISTYFHLLVILIAVVFYSCSKSSDGDTTSDNNPITSEFNDGDWTQRVDFPGVGRLGATGFSIGNKGYMVCGWIDSGDTKLGNEFWEWNQNTDTWVQRADFPGAGMYAASGFSIGKKAYLVCGWADDDNDGSILGTRFWEWDQETDVWTQKEDFPGAPRVSAAGFAIDTKGYIVCGWIEGADSKLGKEFWEWDQETEVWTQKEDFPGEARYLTSGFSIANKGYVACGAVEGNDIVLGNEIWEWKQETAQWTQKEDFSGAARSSATSFAIVDKAYLVCGWSDDGTSNTRLGKEFWEYKLPE